ncbi:hypothetical protein [Salinicoccus roseus]|uniref:hypothetical protein n=1 Tax=Salinicoccus roseus TaxID=45670 RepID=UPI00230145A8|nr:hypothetical protein [Salinicoccus roseus]
MSEFTGHLEGNSDIDFGDYVEIEMHRYGTDNEFYIHKVVGAFRSNMYLMAPLRWDSKPEFGEMTDVLNVIQCGVDETKVIRVRKSDCKKFKHPQK